MQRTERSIIQAVLGVASVMLVFAVATLGVKAASSISQSFRTEDSGIVSGALVSLKSGDANTVELATPENIDRILGVVGQNSLIELSGEDSSVNVVTTGGAFVLVSDINGQIKTGDKISVSPIAGVGMKASAGTVIIGTAQADFSGLETESRTIQDKNGEDQRVRIAALPIQVDKGFYQAPQSEASYVPSALQDLANSIAGRTVSPIRVLMAASLAIFVFVAIVVLLYSSIRSSIISIGRNPLSENAVHKSLLQVGLTVFGVLAFTMLAVYFILTT